MSWLDSPEPPVTRVVSFAGSSVRIDAIGMDAVALVAFLFDHMPAAEGPTPHVTLTVRASGRGPRTLLVNDELFCESESNSALASALLGQVLFHLSDRSTGGLVLHAAAVCRGDRCVLLPGASGTGKTSLTAWLVRRGFEYLTDELVYIPLGSEEVRPFVRPLNVKASARTTVGTDVLDFDALTAQSMTSADVLLIPAGAIGRQATARAPRLEAIVFPHYQAGAALHARPVSEAATGMRLMATLINARNLPAHGFEEVSRLARLIPGSVLEYGDFSQLETWVGHLLTEQVR